MMDTMGYTTPNIDRLGLEGSDSRTITRNRLKFPPALEGWEPAGATYVIGIRATFWFFERVAALAT